MQGKGRPQQNVGRSALVLRWTTALLISALLSSCGILQKVGILSSPPPAAVDTPAPTPLSQQPYELKLILSASAQLNPDTQGRPSPVQVRLFLTDAQSEIGSKSFEQVFDFAGNVMEPRPLATVTMRPGEAKTVVLPAMKSQTLLVIAAAYRDPYQSVWSAVAEISPQDTVNASATVGASIVSINPTP